MRAVLAALLLAPALSTALEPGDSLADAPAVADSATGPTSSTHVLDSVRLFNTTEVYQLEPSDVRAELRFTTGTPGTDPTMEVRAEVGLTRHFQLNLEQDIVDPRGGSPQASATPIGLRYSLGSGEDDVPLNPAVEVTVTPRLTGPASAGLRLLVAEELVPHLVVAANGYLEQSLNRETSAGADGRLGVTSGASYSLLNGHLHLGAEGQVGSVENGDQHLVIAAGPNAVLGAGPCAATLTSMFNLVPRQIGFEPRATVGCTF